MRRSIAVILTLFMVFLILPSQVMAGNIINYRDFKYSRANGAVLLKPVANFKIEVKDSQGNLKTSAETAENLPRESIVPAPVIHATVGDTLVFTDKSYSRAGYSIIAWDWQYWTDDKKVFELKNKMDSQLTLTVPGTYHFYLAVADSAPVTVGETWFWSMNWSDNGNHRDTKELGNGMQGYWYFNEIIVEVEEAVSVPDFHVTTNSAIYEGEPGEEIYAWVTVHNTGTAAATTDLGANWHGEGNNWTTTHHYRSVNEVGVIPAQGTSQQMGVPIIIPETETTMWFKVNLDGKTPEDEINQSNNLTSAIVRPKPKGVDLKITGEVPMPVMTLYGQDKMKTCVDFVVTRKDGGTEPITAELTMWGPAGTKKETIIIGESEVVKTYWYETNQAGTYNFSAQVWPTELTELYPPDNTTQVYTIQYIKLELPKENNPSPIWSELTG